MRLLAKSEGRPLPFVLFIKLKNFFQQYQFLYQDLHFREFLKLNNASLSLFAIFSLIVFLELYLYLQNGMEFLIIFCSSDPSFNRNILTFLYLQFKCNYSLLYIIYKFIDMILHLIRKHHVYFLNTLKNNEIYNFLISSQNEETTSSRLYYQEKSSMITSVTRKIYMLVRIVTKDSKLRPFLLLSSFFFLFTYSFFVFVCFVLLLLLFWWCFKEQLCFSLFYLLFFLKMTINSIFELFLYVILRDHSI